MNYLEIPLDVADVNIKSIEFTEEGEIFITITSTIQGTVCQSCGQKIFDFYGENREITLRHLSILGKPTYLKLRPQRYRCFSLANGHPNIVYAAEGLSPAYLVSGSLKNDWTLSLKSCSFFKADSTLFLKSFRFFIGCFSN